MAKKYQPIIDDKDDLIRKSIKKIRKDEGLGVPHILKRLLHYAINHIEDIFTKK